MILDSKTLNLILGSIVFLLAAVAGVFMYLNWDLPVIREAPSVGIGGDERLPENHPPIDSSTKLAALEQMSRSDPQNAELRTQIGNVYYDMGQYRKAADAYEESLKLRPQDAGVETDLATCYHELGQDDKALSIFDKVLEYKPNHPQALFNKGIVLQSGKKDPKGAVAVWEQLLRTNPDFPQRAELEQKISQLRSSGQ
jgi:cytochrome c-type biogenesis protein CcmH/NrfG